MKTYLPETIGDAVDDIVDETTSVEDTVMQRIALQRMLATLDEREQRIIGYIGEGLTMAEIVEEEGLTLRTTERLVHTVRAKAQAFLEAQL